MKKVIIVLTALAVLMMSAGCVLAEESAPVFERGMSIDLEPGWQVGLFNINLFPDMYDLEGAAPEMPIVDPDAPELYQVMEQPSGGFPYSFVVLSRTSEEGTDYRLLDLRDMSLYDGGRLLAYAGYIFGINAVILPLENGNAGILRGDGTLVSAEGWDRAGLVFSEGMYVICTYMDDDTPNWAFLDAEGTLVKDGFTDCGDFAEGQISVQIDGGRWTYMRGDGSLMAETWAMAKDFHDGRALVELDSGNWSYIRNDGSLLSDTGWPQALSFSGGFGMVKLGDDRYSYVSPEGALLSETGFQAIVGFESGFGRVQLDSGNWTFINPDGALLNETGWSKVYRFSEGIGSVMLDSGKKTFIRADGSLLNDEGWPWFYEFMNGFATVFYEDQAHGNFLRADGTLLSETDLYEPGIFMRNGYAPVGNEDGTFSYIDASGKIYPMSYGYYDNDDCSDYFYGYSWTESGLAYFHLIDPATGERVVPDDNQFENLLNPNLCLVWNESDTGTQFVQYMR